MLIFLAKPRINKKVCLSVCNVTKYTQFKSLGIAFSVPKFPFKDEMLDPTIQHSLGLQSCGDAPNRNVFPEKQHEATCSLRSSYFGRLLSVLDRLCRFGSMPKKEKGPRMFQQTREVNERWSFREQRQKFWKVKVPGSKKQNFCINYCKLCWERKITNAKKYSPSLLSIFLAA